MSLGTRIAQARSELKMSQETLARTIGVATVTPSRWERDKNRPLPEQMPLIAEALEKDVDWLTQDDPAPAPTPSVAGDHMKSAFEALVAGVRQEIALGMFQSDTLDGLADAVAARLQQRIA